MSQVAGVAPLSEQTTGLELHAGCAIKHMSCLRNGCKKETAHDRSQGTDACAHHIR